MRQNGSHCSPLQGVQVAKLRECVSDTINLSPFTVANDRRFWQGTDSPLEVRVVLPASPSFSVGAGGKGTPLGFVAEANDEDDPLSPPQPSHAKSKGHRLRNSDPLETTESTHGPDAVMDTAGSAAPTPTVETGSGSSGSSSSSGGAGGDGGGGGGHVDTVGHGDALTKGGGGGGATAVCGGVGAKIGSPHRIVLDRIPGGAALTAASSPLRAGA